MCREVKGIAERVCPNDVRNSLVTAYDDHPDIQSYKKDKSRKLLADHSVDVQQNSYHTCFPAKTLQAHQNQTFRGKEKEKKEKDLVSDKERFQDAEELSGNRFKGGNFVFLTPQQHTIPSERPYFRWNINIMYITSGTRGHEPPMHTPPSWNRKIRDAFFSTNWKLINKFSVKY